MAPGIKVQKSSGAQRLGHAIWSQAKLNSAVVTPALHNIADDMKEMLVETFNDPSIRYQGGMADGFGVVDVTRSSVGITQSAEYEQYIRQGTGTTQGREYHGFPGPVVAWGQAKLGSLSAGFAVAKSISGFNPNGTRFGPGKGTAQSFINRWPTGEPRFEYPEWAVMEFKDELDKLAQKIGQTIVKWIITGDQWRSQRFG